MTSSWMRGRPVTARDAGAEMRTRVVVIRVVQLIEPGRGPDLDQALELRQQITADLEATGLLDSWADDGVISIGGQVEDLPPEQEVEPWPS